ncbi:MAG: hypothetical protein ACR2GZ_03085 [Solirubrobacteraceae bacterium]
MSSRTGITVFVASAILGLAALLVASAGDGRARAFSIGVPNLRSVAALHPGQSACQSPIVSPARWGGIRAWAGSAPGPGALAVTIRDPATHAQLAGGQLTVVPAPGPITASLSHDVTANRRFELCLRNDRRATVTLLGSGRVDPSVRLTIAGQPSAFNLSLITLRPSPRSLLSLVPTAFSRAALFHARWVGAWTFWLLTGGVLIAFVAMGAALLSAGEDTGGRV